MSKTQLQVRIPENMGDEIEDFEKSEGIENTSEATRQLIWRGLNTDSAGPTPGERLLETATGVAGVSAFGAAFLAPSVAPVFGAATFVLAVVWMSIMVYAGRDLV